MFKHGALLSAFGDGEQEFRVRANHGAKKSLSSISTIKTFAEQEKIYEPTSNE